MGWKTLSITRTGTFSHHPILLSSNGRLRQPLRFTTIHMTLSRKKRSVRPRLPLSSKKEFSQSKEFLLSSFHFVLCVCVSFSEGGRGGGGPAAMVGPPHVGPTAAVPSWLPLSGHRWIPRWPVSLRLGELEAAGSSLSWSPGPA
jgi:hypothetical protein